MSSDKANKWSGCYSEVDPARVQYENDAVVNGNGKGDKPRHRMAAFVKGFDKIDWSKGKKNDK